MFESFLAQLLSDIARRPRLLLHVIIALTLITILRVTGIYLPHKIAGILCLGGVIAQEGEVVVGLDIVVALISLLMFFVLVIVFYYVIDRAIKRALENLSVEDSFKVIGRIRDICFVEDIKDNQKGRHYRLSVLLLFSLITCMSYYSSIMFSLYVLNDLLSMLTFPFFSLLTSKSVVVFTVVSLTLVAILLGIVVPMKQRSGIESLESRGLLEEWFKDAIFKYFFENCVGRCRSAILLCLAPVSPKLRTPYLRYFTLVVPQEMAKARLNGVPSYEIESVEEFSKCMDRALSLEDLSKGISKKLCIAKLYKKSNNKRKFLGILMGFTAVVVMGSRPPLRMLSKYVATVYTKTEEHHTYLAVLAVDPAAGEIIIRLVTG